MADEAYDPGIEAAGYRLERPVARGGMGEIWLARSVATGERVALKRILFDPGGPSPQSLAARLARETEVLARLEHEHVVRYIGGGRDEKGLPFLALEWLEGESLAERLRTAPLDLATSVDIVRQALEGLGACHRAGIVHRDIKPENLFLAKTADGAERVKVLDLGIALVEARHTRLTAAGAVIGTLYYLAPEQARGAPNVDLRADLYSMGVVLYELCTGQLPFEADTPLAVLLKIVTETPPRPIHLDPTIPRWLDEVIVRALSRTPSDRFESAAEMREALQRPLDAAHGAALHRRRSAPPSPLAINTDAPTLLSMSGPFGRTSGEHRIVSLLSVQAGEDAALVEATLSAVDHSGGLAQRLLGGVVVGLFGVEHTVGDEALRCVTAGLAARNAARGPARLLAATVRVEVSEGLKLHSEELDRALASIPTMPPNELVLDAATRQLAGPLVVTETVGGHAVAVALADSSTTRRMVLGVETPLVGREGELATLRAQLGRALDEEEREIVIVTGPSGIGKSRLVSEIRGDLEREAALVLEGRAAAAVRRAPAGLIAEAIARGAGVRAGQPTGEQWRALRQFLSRHASELDDDDVTFLGVAIGLEAKDSLQLQAAKADPKLMQEHVSGALVAFLQRAAERGPVAVWLEDLHWEHPPNLPLFARVLDALDESPVFVVATARDELFEAHPGLFDELEPTRIALKPLGKRGVRRLAAAILQGEVSSELEASIRKWSDGNPYLLEEFLSWLVSRDAVIAKTAEWVFTQAPEALGLPVTLEAALQGRIDALGAERKEILKVAAVFGTSVWDAGIQALHPSASAADLARLVEADLLVAEKDSRFAGAREWSFRHDAVQRVAYGMVPDAARAPLHREAARWLEQQGEPDPLALASHFERAGETARAKDYYADAAARAASAGDPRSAVRYYEESLGEGVAEIARVERVAALAAALVSVARYDDVRARVEELLREPAVLESRIRRAEALWLDGRTLRALGRFDEAVVRLTEARALLSGHPPSDLAFGVERALFWALWLRGDYGAVGEVETAMRELATALGRPDHLSEAELAGASLHLLEGDLSQSVALAELALAHAREVQHRFREADALLLLGSIHAIVGRFDAAREALSATEELAKRMRAPYFTPHIASSRGYVDLLEGRPGAAEAQYVDARAFAQASGDLRGEATALAGIARAVVRQDPGEADLVRAAEDAGRAVELGTGQGQAIEAEARLAAMEVAIAQGHAADAEAHARASLALLDELGTQEQFEIEILLAVHDSLSLAGDRDGAGRVLRRARERLHARAERIGDPAVRASFLERIPHNRRVMA